MRFGQIKIDIYGARVRWFIGDKKEFQKWYNIPDFVLENTEGNDGLTIYYKGYHYMWAAGVDLYKVIPHECLHVVCDIFKVRGIEFDNDNHEHAAYLLGYLTNKIMSKMKPTEEVKKKIEELPDKFTSDKLRDTSVNRYQFKDITKEEQERERISAYENII